MNATIKLILREDKSLTNNLHPIYLRVTINRKSKYYSLGKNFACKLKQWNKEKELFKGDFHDLLNANRSLDLIKSRAKKIIYQLHEKEEAFTINDFDKSYTLQNEQVFVLQKFEDHINYLKKNGKIGNANAYENTRSSIKQFINYELRKNDIEFKNIDFKFLKDYENHLKKTCKDTTVHMRFRTLRALFNKLINEEVIKNYPFKKFRLNHLNLQTQKRALKIDDFRKIMHYKAEEGSRKYYSLLYFKFMYYARGMNFTDIAKLKKSDFEKDRFLYTRSKTGKTYTVFLFPEILEVISEFKDFVKESDYIFPILKNHHIHEYQKKDRIKTVLKRLNSDLNSIASDCGIEIRITTYVIRHTFATILKYLGESTSIISEHLGHSSERVTQIYLDQFEEDILKNSVINAVNAVR